MAPSPGHLDTPGDADADDLADSALLAGLRDRAAARNRERTRELVGFCDDLERHGRLAPEALARVGAVVHALAGSAGTFGHPEVSALAGRVGDRFRSDGPTIGAQVAELRAVLATITGLLGGEPSAADGEPDTDGNDSPLR